MTIQNRTTQAFNGLAKEYNNARPSYPKELFLSILHFWQDKQTSDDTKPRIADVGCGTGISTRAIFSALNGNCTIIGIEPGSDMLTTAKAVLSDGIKYIEGSAESLPLETETIDIITVAQAAQWFDRPAFYKEVERVLAINGIIAIYENNRDWHNSEFLRKHEEILETYSVDTPTKKKYSRYYRDFPYKNELSDHFIDSCTLTFPWVRMMTPADFLAMVKTSTQMKRVEEPIGKEKIDALVLENAFSHLTTENQVEVKYSTKLYMARKKHD